MFLCIVFVSKLLMMVVCRSLEGLELFPNLEELILDSNGLSDSVLDSLPLLHKVHFFSLNKNKISFAVSSAMYLLVK